MKNYSVKLCVALFFAAQINAACGERSVSPPSGTQGKMINAQPEKNVGREELVSVLRSKDFDKAIETFNRIKRMRYQGDLIPLILNLWSGNLSSESGLDEVFINHPVIKLEIADVLLQAGRNGAEVGSLNQYGVYARTLVRAGDPTVARAATLILGISGGKTDADLLIELIFEGRSATLKAATWALAKNCTVNEERINSLVSELRGKPAADELLDAWKSAQDLRQHLCKSAAAT